MIKIFTLLVLSFFSFGYLNAQSEKAIEYVITLSSLEKFAGNYDYYKPLFKYGNVFHRTFPNGITKIYLQKLDKTNFASRSDAQIVLKPIKKIKNFKDAYTSEAESKSTFSAPNVQVKDKELVITVKLNSDESGDFTEKKVEAKPISYSTNKTKYWIQIGCFAESKTSQELTKNYGLNRKDEIRNYKSDGCTRYLIGVFDSHEQAEKRLQELRNCDDCQIVGEKWDDKRQKLVIVKNI